MERQIASLLRQRARQRGDLFYRTSKPCKRGHHSRRYVSTGMCVTCQRSFAKTYRADPVKYARYLAKNRQWRKTPKGKASHNASKRKYLSTPRGKALARIWRRRSAGLPEPTREEPTFCECCGRKSTRGSLCLDHCHVTHTFRGWLCDRCNRALGLLGDDVDTVCRLAQYLQQAGNCG